MIKDVLITLSLIFIGVGVGLQFGLPVALMTTGIILLLLSIAIHRS